MPEPRELRDAGDRIATLVEELGRSGPAVKGKAEDLVRLLMELYGAGLDRILSVIDESGPAAGGIFARLMEDELVASLLVLHDLHPLDLPARIEQALHKVRPYLGSHGGDVELLGVEEGVVRIRLTGSCHGCPSSSITLKLAVERAIEEAAPEIVSIEVEGATLAEAPLVAGDARSELVCIGGSRPDLEPRIERDGFPVGGPTGGRDGTWQEQAATIPSSAG